MSDRSLIFNAKGTQIGYVEGSRAFDLSGRERCNYARKTGNLTDLTGEKIVGYISLDGTFVGYLGYLKSCLESRVVKFIRTVRSPESGRSINVRRRRTCSSRRGQTSRS